MIKPFRIEEDDWQRFRDIRLKGLVDCPSAFSSTFDTESRYSEKEWREYTHEFHWTVFFDSDDSEDVAIMSVKEADPNLGWVKGSNCWLNGFWIDPRYRGKEKNVMKDMIQELDVFCQERNWNKQSLGVWIDNERAIKAYERFGFILDETPVPSTRMPGKVFFAMFRTIKY
jgi:RimJ/RimL family protein N-acetyltransferase